MEKMREKMLCALITILLCGTVFSVLSQPAMPEKAEKGTPQVTVTIKRIEAVDAMDLLDEADWYYWVGFALSTSSSISWSRYPSSGANSNSNVWEPNSVHTYTTPSNPGSVYLYIMLCDDDNEVGLNLPDDLADISDDAGGGYDDVAIDITPPGGLSYYFGTYVGIYDMITNTLSGNYTEFVNNMYKTSGNFDGSTSIDQNDANLYFTITDNYDKPTARISASTYTAHINENIVFSGTNSNASQASTIVSYSWNFGDGHTGSGSQVTHAYSATGQYTVSLTVTDDWGQTSTATTVINITNAPPKADFTYTPAQPTVLDTIQFTDQSTDPDGFITAWAWNFGDGNTSTQQNPTHKYSARGSYTVSLMVTDNNGATNTTTRTITMANAPPNADFTYTPVQPTVLDTIQFTDQSTDPDGSITAWAWNFGDGTTSTQQNPTHKYSARGTYTVSLTVTDNNGATNTVTHTITLANAQPVANFTYTPAQPTILDTIQFTDQSTDADGFITAWAWNFGDGNTSTQQNPTHKYSAKGTYTVSLMVTDNNGATNTTVRTITVVNAPPVANFTYTPAQPTILDTIQFNDASTDPDGSITSWLWDFGDNYTSTEKNPSHKYNTPGTYTVKLTVTDNDGGSATKSIQINVREATNVGSITGTVEDSNGTKLEGVVITVTSGGTTVGTAVTDTAGRYTVSGLTPGKYDIKAHKDGYEDSIQYSVSVSAGNTTTVNFVLSKIGTTGSIAGTVKDASGNPIANAEICVYKEGTSILVKKAISGTDGSYTISGLSPGKYDVVFSATGYENRTIASQEVKSGETTTVNAVLTKIGGEGTQGAGMLLWLLPLLIIIIVVVIIVVYLLKKKSSPGQPQQPPQYQQPPQP